MGHWGGHGSPSLNYNGRTKRFLLLPTVTIRPGSAPHSGWRERLERKSKMLLKRATIAYRTADMRGLFSVDQTPRTSALSQVTICPGSAPPRMERVSGEGIPHAVETQHDCCGRKKCAYVAQTPRTSSLSQVQWTVAKFSKPPLPTNAKSGQDKDDDG